MERWLRGALTFPLQIFCVLFMALVGSDSWAGAESFGGSSVAEREVFGAKSSSGRSSGSGGARGGGWASVIYAETPSFWKGNLDLWNSRSDVVRVNEMFRGKYGTFREFFSSMNFEFEDARFESPVGALSRFYFGVAGETVIWQALRNPVISELHGRGLGMGNVLAGMKGRVPSLGVTTRVGLMGGLGYGGRSDAMSSDFWIDLPIKYEVVGAIGFDFEVNRLAMPRRGWDWETSVLYQGSSYFTSLDRVVRTNRWQYRLGAERDLGSTFLGRFHYGFHGILGPQPLPVKLLPRAWDFIHETDPLPELGAMVGGGGELKFFAGRHGVLQLISGYYGGYWGGAVMVRGETFQLSSGSWGIGSSSIFHGPSQRVWLMGLGMAI